MKKDPAFFKLKCKFLGVLNQGNTGVSDIAQYIQVLLYMVDFVVIMIQILYSLITWWSWQFITRATCGSASLGFGYVSVFFMSRYCNSWAVYPTRLCETEAIIKMIILFHLAGQELDKISVWFRANRLFFNIKKSNFTFFKTCQKKINYAMVMEPLLIDRWCPY